MALTVSMPSTTSPGGTITVTVSGVTPGEAVAGGFDITQNSFIPVSNAENGIVVTANAQGVATWQWHILANTPPGFYQAFVLRINTGEKIMRNLQVTTGGIGGIPQQYLIYGAIGLVALYLLTGRR